MKDQNKSLGLKNGDNHVQPTCAWTSHRRLRMTIPQVHLKEFFRGFDKDNDRRLSKQDLKNAFDSLGSRFPCWRATRVLHHAYANGNGYVSEQELDSLVKYAVKRGYDKE